VFFEVVEGRILGELQMIVVSTLQPLSAMGAMRMLMKAGREDTRQLGKFLGHTSRSS